jgi:imidazole glycerol-phosphate synthase subunit HisH
MNSSDTHAPRPSPRAPEVAVIDYGMGNLRSVQKGFERVGVAAEVTSDAERIAAAAGVVLPGVGAFGACMENLTAAGLIEPVREAIASGRPFLGICVGLQLLFEESEEFGPVAGLGILRGRCRRFPHSDDVDLRVPHMGWNQIDKRQPSPLLEGIDDGAFVYFVHSYYAEAEDRAVVAASTTYGVEFVASVARDNLYGCQFHPEKSQQVGLKILENFGNIVRKK